MTRIHLTPTRLTRPARAAPRSTLARASPLVAAVLAVAVMAACSPPGSSATEPVIETVRIASPVREPIWSPTATAIFALTETGSRVVRVDPREGHQDAPTGPARSRTLTDLGENVAAGISRDVLYVPQPDHDRIAVLDTTDLHQVATLPGGDAPALVTVNSGADDLLALSEGRSVVTPIDLQAGETLPAISVDGGIDAEIDGASRGRRIDYHLTGPDGILHYKGSPGAVTLKGALDVPVGKTKSDLVKPSRVYAAKKYGHGLLAVEPRPGEHGLRVASTLRMSAPVEYLDVDENRLYAATEDELVIMKTNSFKGDGDRQLDVIKTVDFRKALPTDESSAPLAGLVVGNERIYLTFHSARSILGIAKPDV